MLKSIIGGVRDGELTLVELGRAYREVMDLNEWGQRELAEFIGEDEGVVAGVLSGLELPKDLQSAVDAGWLDVEVARAVTQAPSHIQHEFANLAIREGLTPQEVAEAIRGRGMGDFDRGRNLMSLAIAAGIGAQEAAERLEMDPVLASRALAAIRGPWK